MTSITATKTEAQPVRQALSLLTRGRRHRLKRTTPIWDSADLVALYAFSDLSDLRFVPKKPGRCVRQASQVVFWPTLHNYEVVFGLTIPDRVGGDDQRMQPAPVRASFPLSC